MVDNSDQRQRAVLERLDQNAFVSVTRLAEDLGCSEMTVRRDLARLEGEGKLRRRRGGAVPTRMGRLEFSTYERVKQNRGIKEAIARSAIELVKSGQRLILDTGTTTLALANELRGREGITVVTTSLAIVSALMVAPGVECILLGGTVRETSPDLYGPLVEDNLSRLHADVAFVGCDGLSVAGELMTTDHRVARATQLMIANSSRAVLLTDSSKAGRSSFVTFGKLDELDCLVTDAGMPAEILGLARGAGVETVVVAKED
jgi:DeoR/GlpR family transcriptional regulator of sugar metabolism